jgi:hypothetical protein
MRCVVTKIFHETGGSQTIIGDQNDNNIFSGFGVGADNLTGGSLNDRFVMTTPDLFVDHINGGGGEDTVDYSAAQTGLNINLGSGSVSGDLSLLGSLLPPVHITVAEVSNVDMSSAPASMTLSPAQPWSTDWMAAQATTRSMLPAAIERVRRKLASADDGNRQMVDILNAVLTDGLQAVAAACAEAIAHGVHSADVVLNILARQRDPAPPANILAPAALTLRHAPIADCARYDNLRRTN